MNLTVDAGFVPVPPPPDSGDVSGLLWVDTDRDGIREPGEPPWDDVAVQLLGPGETALDTTFPATDGSYRFAGLAAGEYAVLFVTSLSFTLRDAGSDDPVDSDVDPATGTTAVLTLGDGDRITAVDAGVQPPPA